MSRNGTQHAFPTRLHVRAAKTQIRLTRVFADRALDPWLPIECPAKTDADVQADLSLRRAHKQCCRKYCAPAQFVSVSQAKQEMFLA